MNPWRLSFVYKYIYDHTNIFFVWNPASLGGSSPRLNEFIVPNVYASLILAMYDELKLEPEDIKRVVLRSQQIWNDYTDNGWDIKASCEECTGIDVRYYKTTGNIV